MTDDGAFRRIRMFDAQKLLGQMMREAAGGSLGGGKRRKRGSGSFTGLPSGMEAKLGMGLLGLAIAAYEHVKQPGAQTLMGGAAPSPPTPTGQAAAAPPPPPSVRPPPPPPRSPGAAVVASTQDQSLHLLRAMISAANADGVIDATERDAVLARAREAGLDVEDLAALEAEIARPLALHQLVAQTPEALREQVYVAALIAIDPDHPDEHAFLQLLGAGLRLGDAERAALASRFDTPHS
jgi:uncharacterized membrane protein YebE (DUF533 family)